MDLGILPGTVIRNEIVSAGGDPIAYRIRGAVIALRKSQAELINVCREDGECDDIISMSRTPKFHLRCVSIQSLVFNSPYHMKFRSNE